MLEIVTPIKSGSILYNSTSTYETITELSAELENQYGKYRVFRMNDKYYRVASKCIHNYNNEFKPGDVAEVTISENVYHAPGESYISGLDFSDKQTLYASKFKNEESHPIAFTTEVVTIDKYTQSDITNQYGAFRAIQVNGNDYAVKPWRILNSELFVEGCTAELQIARYKSAYYIKVLKFLPKN